MKPAISSNAVIMFMRAPLQGKVKTRLAKTLGDEKAAEFYRRCIESMVAEICGLPEEVKRYVLFDGPVHGYQTDRLIDLGFGLAMQEGGNLGQRLSSAFNMILEKIARKVVIVASDVPDLTRGIIQGALDSLDDSDVSIGPCHDGGYYLIGMKELHRELFNDISWSTGQVYKQTLDAAKKKGLVISELPILVDIDTEADLRRWSKINNLKNSSLMDFLRTVGI